MLLPLLNIKEALKVSFDVVFSLVRAHMLFIVFIPQPLPTQHVEREMAPLNLTMSDATSVSGSVRQKFIIKFWCLFIR